MNITLNSLSDYNAGRIIFRTFDLSSMDQDEYLTAVGDWLEGITKRRGDGELREEWNVADIEDIPRSLVGEYDLSHDFWEYKEAIESSHLDAEVFQAAVDAGVDVSNVDDCYAGQWSSDREFAENFFDDVHGHDVPEFMQNYIDYDAFTRDLMYDITECDGHYFWSI